MVSCNALHIYVAIITILTGPCAAGKTTVGGMLARDHRIARAVFLETDSIRRSVWRGYVPPYPESPASFEQLRLAARATARVARLYAEKGYRVFLEDVLDPQLMPTYSTELEGCDWNVCCLLPPKNELLARDSARPPAEQIGRRCLRQWVQFRDWARKYGWMVVGCHTLSAHTTVDEILAGTSLPSSRPELDRPNPPSLM